MVMDGNGWEESVLSGWLCMARSCEAWSTVHRQEALRLARAGLEFPLLLMPRLNTASPDCYFQEPLSMTLRSGLKQQLLCNKYQLHSS